ncbi:Lipase 4 [Candida viswanathii]|uniref:Lipase n=1 Tax=Candida viswanathii TaxID=5486 RepID=A0A367YKR2_9ASCO|nr:Lipase 4 [Candida viswanathii]
MRFLLLLFALLAPIHGALLSPTKPSNDPFYNAPEGYEDANVGDILQYRTTPNAITGAFFPSKVQNSWQLLIRSEDSFGQPNVFVTTIIQPFNADPSKLVSYQVFEDAAKLDCAPSYALQYGSSITTITTQAELPFIAVLLNQGYYVVVPDYEGPKLAYTVGRQSGQAVLNSVRGALKSGNFTGLDESPDVVLWGYSGGSLALGWAAALQPQYAPELEPRLLGAALGGFVTNITASAVAADGTVLAGIIANALGGLGNEYEDVKNALLNDTTTLLRSRVNQFDDYCLIDGVINFAGTQFFTGAARLFRSGYDLLNRPEFREIIDGNGLVYYDAVPSIPIFIYHGTLDEVVPISNVRKTYQRWCDGGIASLEFSEDATNGHITQSITGAPAALTWIMARFNGTAPVSGCSHVQRISNFAYPGVPAAILEYFESLFKTLVGAGLGPDVQKDDISVSGLSKLSSLLSS